MAAVDVGARNNPPAPTDDLDDLFDYDVSADIFEDVDTNTEMPSRLAKAPLGDAGKEKVGGLGIDEEIKVTKKRAPVAKLDEARLLSQAGIPKLRKITKERLKFKGKGHEYSDVARLLNVYQLWLDDLYPRAKFADGLAMIEKVGHTKRMQTMRKEWINEGKPKDKYDDYEPATKVPERNEPSAGSVQHTPSDGNPALRTQTPAVHDWSNDDLFGVPKESSKAKKGPSENATADSLFLSDNEGGNDAPLEDDLDALLAEDEINAKIKENALQHQNDSNGIENDNFADEMEAMVGLDDMW